MDRLLMIADKSGKVETGKRVYIDGAKGKNEAWLRDMMFNHPDLLPVEDIDQAFGPLIPLCTEFQIDTGRVDALFINESGRLTILECKLWKNPEARREVVAQAIDYVKELSRWSYSDLQRQVSKALHKAGNVPFDVVRRAAGSRLREPEFVDAVSRSLREGRFLVLVIGDGIREGIQSLTEFVSAPSSKAFQFGIVEAAVYHFGNGRLAIHPRILAKTQVLKRQITVFNVKGAAGHMQVEDAAGHSPEISIEVAPGGKRKHLRAWWQPVMKMKFDDPDQEPPRWLVTNNVALSTPYPGVQIKAWATVDRKGMGVFVTGSQQGIDKIRKFIKADRRYLLEHLPKGTIIDPGGLWPVVLKNAAVLSDSERYMWLQKALNEFVNVLRPRLRRWFEAASV